MFIFCRNVELSIFNILGVLMTKKNQKELFLWSFYLSKVRVTGARKKWKK